MDNIACENIAVLKCASNPGVEEHKQPTQNLSDLLQRAVDQLRDMGDGYDVPRREIRVLRERFAQGRFHLAVLGQFKRGKSSLLNALLGEPLLPTSVVPLTAIPTLLYPASDSMIRVRFRDGTARDLEGGMFNQRAAFIAAFVAEIENPQNHLQVSQVEIFSPDPLLTEGVVLIDTPGIGSTLRHNTEAALNFLPQCDAALFLISADPPITDVEIAFLREVRAKIPRIIFVLNKVDYLDNHERKAALAFLRRALHENAGIDDPDPIFLVSARQGLEARRKKDRALWRASGMAGLEAHLVAFLAREKAAALCAAITRKACEQIEAAVLQMNVTLQALQMPLTDLEDRCRVFDQKLMAIDRERVVTRDLLTGDAQRLRAQLEHEAKHLRATTRRQIEDQLIHAAAPGHESQLREDTVNHALHEMIPVLFEHVFGDTTRRFEGLVAEVLEPHRQRADDLIQSVRRTAAELFAIPYTAPDAATAFHLAHEPYWITHKWESAISPIPSTWLDVIFPSGIRRRRVRKRIAQQIDALIVHNVENLRWAILQSLNDTIGRYALDLDTRLKETVAATKGAMQAAIEKRRLCQDEVGPEIERIQTAVKRMSSLKAQLEIEGNLGEIRAAAVARSPEKQ